MLIDIGWLLIAAAIQHYAVGRRMSGGNRAGRSAGVAFISWVVFKWLGRAVSMGGGSAGEALVTGTVFGAIALAVVILAQLRGLAKHREPGTD